MSTNTEPKESRPDDTESKIISLEEISKPRRVGRPNYALIHSRPLPVVTYPLPAFIPHNPLSVIHVVYKFMSQLFFPPTSHPEVYNGYFSSSTRSVHVTDPKHMRALWEMGFFGKGSLSRSEPTWLDQEKKRIGLMEGETAEEITRKRRLEREKFKRERARVERQTLEDQLRKESGNPAEGSQEETELNENPSVNGSLPAYSGVQKPDLERKADIATTGSQHDISAKQSLPVPNSDIINQEHHQLTLDEAFFLTYSLGCLRLNAPENALDNHSLLQLFRQHSYFPPVSPPELSPDDPFILNYVVYHHFRSLGWIIRDGIKFAVDYLLYERGPVFKHAAFAIMIIPSYTHPYWQKPERQLTKTQKRKGGKDWTWFHCVNRVQTQVVKTLVLVYVDVPPPQVEEERDIGKLLGSYKIREFCMQRWSANRSRD